MGKSINVRVDIETFKHFKAYCVRHNITMSKSLLNHIKPRAAHEANVKDIMKGVIQHKVDFSKLLD